jgi:cell division protease FtsH
MDKTKDRQAYLWKWAKELQETVRAVNPHDRWEVLGHGLVVESNDADECEQSIRLICEQINVGYQYLNSQQILDIDLVCGGDSSNPKVIFIESDNWIHSTSDDDESTKKQKKIANFIKGLEKSPIVCILVVDNYDDIATCFRYQGIFDRHLQWEEPKPEYIGQDLVDLVGQDKFDISILNATHRLGYILCSDFSVSRRIGILASALKRVAHFQNRQIEWHDIYRIVISGTVDGYELTRNKNDLQVSVHEAGHALITILETDSKNLPEIATILSGKGYQGVVVENYQYCHETEGPMSFKAACTKIRIALAGRVAEELIFGKLEVDIHLAKDDLKRASWIAFDLVTKGGFDHDHESSKFSGVNLFVPERDASKVNDYYLSQARSLLEKQYKAVSTLITAHRDKLDLIVDELLSKKFLTHQDFRNMGFSSKVSAFSTN